MVDLPRDPASLFVDDPTPVPLTPPEHIDTNVSNQRMLLEAFVNLNARISEMDARWSQQFNYLTKIVLRLDGYLEPLASAAPK